MKLAITGKGGSGKTTIAGTMARIYSSMGYKVLAIDVDDNPNLAITLGIPMESIELSRPVPTRVIARSNTGLRLLMEPDEIIEKYGIKGPHGIRLLIMTKIERAGVGCACGSHATIREIVHHIEPHKGEVVVMDMEPGLEIFGRATPKYTNVVLAVAEPYFKSVVTAVRIAELAKDLGIENVYGVINKVRSADERQLVEKVFNKYNVRIIGVVPYDNAVYEADKFGYALIDYKPESKAIIAIREIAERLIDYVGRGLAK